MENTKVVSPNYRRRGKRKRVEMYNFADINFFFFEWTKVNE